MIIIRTSHCDVIDVGVPFCFDRVESMTMHRNTSALAPLNPAVFEHDLARQVLIPMG